MPCSPPTSFPGVSMESIAICSSILSRLDKVCRFFGNPQNMSSEHAYAHDREIPMKNTTSRLLRRIGRLMPSCKGAKLMDGKVFKGSVGHQELAAWVDELEL